MNARTFMNKCVGALIVLAFAGAGMGTISANAQSTPRQVTHSTYETWLNKQVRHELVTLPWIGVFDNLEYRIDGSQVTLMGQVIRPVTKSDAEARIKHIEGVTRVINRIQVLPLSNFDDQIRRAEYRAIFSEPSLSRYSMGVIPAIHIIVDNGHVTLEGVVDNDMDRNLARMRALGVPGVFSVVNNLRVG